MQPVVKLFLEKHVDLLEDNNLELFFTLAAEAVLETHLMNQLSDVLHEIGIETDSVRWKVFDNLVNQYIDGRLNAPSFAKDRANSWARVDYMLDEISDMGFGWHDAKAHVVANGKKYNTTVTALEPEYGWQGDGDYAFIWFDKKAFDEEYSYDI